MDGEHHYGSNADLDAIGLDPGVWGNELSGRVSGAVLQARNIGGDVHVHGPGPATLPPPPRQLPPVSAVFTGRRDDLHQLDEHWNEAAAQGTGLLLVISGTAGVGKTTLAVAWLARHMAAFADGCLYADMGGYSRLGPASAGDVTAGFLRAMGVAPERVPAALAERAALLRTVTFGRRVGVLIDNAVSAAQVRTISLTSPGCATVVTTRGTLTGLAMDGARYHQLQPWRAQTALLLMKQILGEQRVAAEPQAALEVAQLCGGLPLAVGVAAAKLVARPRWPLARLARALAEDEQRLEVLSDDEDIVIARALDGSYDVLSPRAQQLYRTLGVYPLVWFDPDTAAVALVSAPEDAEREIDLLVDANLLEDLSGSYRFHDLVRLHAARQARKRGSEQDQTTALERLCDFYLRAATRVEELVTPSHRILERDYQHAATVQITFEDERPALDWLDRQRPNLMALLRYCAGQRWYRIVWQLADAMWPLFLRRRHVDDRLEAQRLALKAVREDNNPRAEGNMLTSLAGTLTMAGYVEESVDLHLQAIALYERLADKRGLAQACNGLAKLRLSMGQAELAGPLFQRALELRREVGYRRGMYLSYQGLGLVACARSDWGAAVRNLRRSYRGLAAVGDHYDATWSLAHLANANSALGHHGQAVRQLQRAQRSMIAASSVFGQAGIQELAGQVHERLGEVDQARACYATAAQLFAHVDSVAETRARQRLDALAAQMHNAVRRDV